MSDDRANIPSVSREEMNASASDMDRVAVRNPLDDDHYVNTPWSHDPVGESRVQPSSSPLVANSVLTNLDTVTSHPGDGPRPLALGLSVRDA